MWQRREASEPSPGVVRVDANFARYVWKVSLKQGRISDRKSSPTNQTLFDPEWHLREKLWFFPWCCSVSLSGGRMAWWWLRKTNCLYLCFLLLMQDYLFFLFLTSPLTSSYLSFFTPHLFRQVILGQCLSLVAFLISSITSAFHLCLSSCLTKAGAPRVSLCTWLTPEQGCWAALAEVIFSEWWTMQVRNTSVINLPNEGEKVITNLSLIQVPPKNKLEGAFCLINIIINSEIKLITPACDLHPSFSRAALRLSLLLIATDTVSFTRCVCLPTAAIIVKPSRSESLQIHSNLKQVQRQSSFTDEVTVIKGFWGFSYHLANFPLPWEIWWQDRGIV